MEILAQLRAILDEWTAIPTAEDTDVDKLRDLDDRMNEWHKSLGIAVDDLERELLNTIILLLLDHLPDSAHDDDESWLWCWNELSDDAQEAVKDVRRCVREFISKDQAG